MPLLQLTPSMTIAYWFAGMLFVLGGCIGSFLNVVVYRLPAGLSLVSPPSRCPKCETPIHAFDNVPVLSWLLLRGRCRSCSVWIPLRYPSIELITALGFARIGWTYGLEIDSTVYDLASELGRVLSTHGGLMAVALVSVSCLVVLACWCLDKVAASRAFLGLVIATLAVSLVIDPANLVQRLASAISGIVVGCFLGWVWRPSDSSGNRHVINTISIGVLVAVLRPDGWLIVLILIGVILTVVGLYGSIMLRRAAAEKLPINSSAERLSVDSEPGRKIERTVRPMPIWAFCTSALGVTFFQPFPRGWALRVSTIALSLVIMVGLTALTAKFVPKQSLA